MSTQQPALPTYVVNAATRRHLGTYTRGGASQFKGTPAGGCGVAFLFTVAAVSAIVGVALLSSPQSGLSVILFIVAGISLPLGIISSHDNNPQAHWSYVIYQNGFVRWRPDDAEAYTWQDFASAHDKIIEYRRYGHLTGRSYHLKLTLKNGRNLRFEESLSSYPIPGMRPTYLQEIAYHVKSVTAH